MNIIIKNQILKILKTLKIRTNLKKINSQQKHAIRIIFNKNKFALTTKNFWSRKTF